MRMWAIMTVRVRVSTAVVLYVRVLIVRTSCLEPLVVPSAAYLVPGTGTSKQLTDYRIRGTESVSRVKTSCGQGLPHYVVLQAEQRLSHSTEKAKRSFPTERGYTAKHHPAAWNPPSSQGRGGSAPLPFLTKKKITIHS